MDFWDLFLTFFKIGAFSFGGGYAMIPFFEREIITHHWTAAGDYTKMIAIAQIIPGPFAIDSATYIGYQVAGFCGAVLASLSLSLPSFISLILVTRFYLRFQSNKLVQTFLESIRPAVIGLLISAIYIIGIQPFIGPLHGPVLIKAGKALLIFIPCLWALSRHNINPFALIVLSGLAGYLLF